MTAATATETLCLGLEGHNPCGFLAALGAADAAGCRLAWRYHQARFVGVLDWDGPVEALAERILDRINPRRLHPGHPWYLIRSATQTASGVERYGQIIDGLIEATKRRHVVRDLTEMWRYTDGEHARLNLRIDPWGVNEPYAYRWSDPTTDPKPINLGGMLMAAHGIGALETMPASEQIAAMGVTEAELLDEAMLPIGWHKTVTSTKGDEERYDLHFRWPVWADFVGGDVMRWMPAHRHIQHLHWYESRRMLRGKVRVMSPTVGIGHLSE